MTPNTTPLPAGKPALSSRVCDTLDMLCDPTQRPWLVDSLDALTAHVIVRPGPWLVTVKAGKPGRTVTAMHAGTRDVLRAQHTSRSAYFFKKLASAMPGHVVYIDPVARLTEEKLAALLSALPR